MEHLAGWSLELSDEAFAAALAALGALAALDRLSLGRAWDAGGWRVDRLAELLTEAMQGHQGQLACTVPLPASRRTAPRLRVAGAPGGKTQLVTARKRPVGRSSASGGAAKRQRCQPNGFLAGATEQRARSFGGGLASAGTPVGQPVLRTGP
jgi:hypothetical protein